MGRPQRLRMARVGSGLIAMQRQGEQMTLKAQLRDDAKYHLLKNAPRFRQAMAS